MGDDQNDIQATAAEHINLKVMGPDNAVVQFKIRMLTPLSKLMKAYCERAGLDSMTVRFHFDGRPVGKDDTPTSLEMEDGDSIDVYTAQIGGRHSI